MFARIRLPIGAPRKALLVIDRALGSDQGLKYVDVVNEKGEVEYRRVTTGPLQEDGLRVIEAGLKPGELVAVGGLQQIRPKMKVQTDQVPMPTLASPETATSSESNPPPTPGKSKTTPPGASVKSQG